MGEIRAKLTGTYREDAFYPQLVINVTNRCNLECKHCFVYRDGNPNEAPEATRDEFEEEAMLDTLAALRDRHRSVSALWMGGEPMLRKHLVARGVKLFSRNTITTNGMVPLLDLGPELLYVVSLDGPETVNDSIRGKGVYQRVMQTLARLPPDFSSPVQVQCVVTKANQRHLAQLVAELRPSPVKWMTFSFYVPTAQDVSGNAWANVEERVSAVREVMRLKAESEGFIRNTQRSLELMLPPHAKVVTDACPARRYILPLYQDREGFTTPYCCYGNDVDCSRCGAWVVFHFAAELGLDADHPTLPELDANSPFGAGVRA